MANPNGEVLVYEAADGSARVDVRLEQDTVWLTQRQMSYLFETTPENVLMHLKNVFSDGELEEGATANDFLVVQTEGGPQVSRNLKHYNLDDIISVGYRVNSRRGVHFRQWATRGLLEYDEHRLATPPGARPSKGVLDHARASVAIADYKRELP